MSNSATETVIGAVVLVAAAGFFAFAGKIGGMSAGSDNYELRASFFSAEGVNVGTDVRLAGIKIGSVVGMELNPETYQAETRIAIDREILLPDDSDIKIASEGLLGGTFVEVTPGGSDFMLNDGEEILLTQSAVSLLNLLLTFATQDTE